MGVTLAPLMDMLAVAVLLVAGGMLVVEMVQPLYPALQRRYGRYWQRVHLPMGAILPFLAALVAAILMRGMLIGAFLITVGAGVGVYRARREGKRRRVLPTGQILQLILAFRSVYQLQPSVFTALDAARDKVGEPLAGLADSMVQTYHATWSPQRAFAKLRARTDNVYLGQFAYVLEMSETARPEAVVEAVDNLVERLRKHDALHREAEASLVSITGQTSVIQLMAALVIVGVAAIPALRRAFGPPEGQVLFIIAVSVMLLASYYIDHAIDTLEGHIS